MPYDFSLCGQDNINKSIAYSHVDETNQVVQGQIIHCPCNAKIRIFSPLDRSDRHDIIYVTGPHNQPKFPSTKPTWKGKDTYREAISTVGVTGLTVVNCDSGSYVQQP
jgi:hypothetical protein